MAVCPECAYEESPPTSAWIRDLTSSDETSFPVSGLVVCPDCDVVLGGVQQ
ncbi:MAG: hypothetical protein ABEH83_10930 [Halobacterium sp.]